MTEKEAIKDSQYELWLLQMMPCSIFMRLGWLMNPLFSWICYSTCQVNQS